MAQLLCDNGHLVRDPEALSCPDCGAPAQLRGKTFASDVTVKNPGPSQPMSLMISGVVLGVVAGIILGAANGNGFGIFLASVVLTFASTFWLVGMIAMGVRIGMRED